MPEVSRSAGVLLVGRCPLPRRLGEPCAYLVNPWHLNPSQSLSLRALRLDQAQPEGCAKSNCSDCGQLALLDLDANARRILDARGQLVYQRQLLAQAGQVFAVPPFGDVGQ